MLVRVVGEEGFRGASLGVGGGGVCGEEGGGSGVSGRRCGCGGVGGIRGLGRSSG